MRRTFFSQRPASRVDQTRWSRRSVFVLRLQGCLLAAGYGSRHPDRCPDWHLTIAAVITCRQKVPKTATITTGLMQCSTMSPGSASTTRAREMHRVFGCSDPLTFQQNDDKLGQAHYSCRGGLPYIIDLIFLVMTIPVPASIYFVSTLQPSLHMVQVTKWVHLLYYVS